MSDRDLPSIHVAFECVPDCETCGGAGHVCEEHPDRPWGGLDPSGCDCGAPGMPCPEIVKRHA